MTTTSYVANFANDLAGISRNPIVCSAVVRGAFLAGGLYMAYLASNAPNSELIERAVELTGCSVGISGSVSQRY